jgi:Ca2+-binding EF-hand superfamily protein
MNKAIRVLALLTLALLAVPALADADHDSALMWFDGFDRNHDRILTVDDIVRGGGKAFRRGDMDGDGALNALEYVHSLPEGETDERERWLRRFNAMDENADAIVTVEEFEAFATRVVQGADADGDGAMTRDEFELAIAGDEEQASLGILKQNKGQ